MSGTLVSQVGALRPTGESVRDVVSPWSPACDPGTVPPYRFRPSHRRLLLAPDQADVEGNRARSAPAERGLVVVPATRSVGSLATATHLAAELGWQLIVVCSHGLRAPQLLSAATRHRLPGVLSAVDLPRESVIRGHRWRTPRHPASRSRQHIDTHRKRNLALAVGRLLRVDALLFLDDDVRGLRPHHVVRALRHRSGPRRDWSLWCWPHSPYPDNSVVCHAGRDFRGVEQDVFLGAGALLLNVPAVSPSFFPPVYNDDWLFAYGALAQGAVIGDRTVRQTRFDPYADPHRAASEEFGDVLGEGLSHLLHERLPVSCAQDPAFWEPVREVRRQMIDETRRSIRGQLERRNAQDAVREHNALVALTAARHELTRVTSHLLATFVRDWQLDRQDWGAWLEDLPARDTLVEALRYLHMPPGSYLTWRDRVA